MDLKRKVIVGLSWSAGGRLLGQLATWGVTIIVIRLLSPEDYGLMELAGVFVVLLAMLNEMGMGAAVVQRKEIDDKILRAIFGWILVSSLCFYFLLTIAAPFIARFYSESRLELIIRVLSVQLLLTIFSVLPSSLLQRNMEFRKIAGIEFVSSIAGSFTTLALALSGYGVWALVWGILTIRLVNVVGVNVALPFLRLPIISINGMRGLLSFGGYVTLSRILWSLYSRADTLIIGKILGKELLGLYSVGMYLASLPMEKVSGLINQVAFPAFASVQSDKKLATLHFLKAVRIMCFFAFPVLWGISSIAPEIVAIFLGEKWIAAVLPVRIIALIIPIRMVSNLMDPAVLGVGRADISVRFVICAFIIMPSAFLLGSMWGLLGVSMSWIVAFPVVFILNLLQVKKVLELRLLDVFKAMQIPFIAGVVMYGGLQVIRETAIMDFNSIQKMIALVAVGSFIYILLTLVFNQKILFEIKDLSKT